MLRFREKNHVDAKQLNRSQLFGLWDSFNGHCLLGREEAHPLSINSTPIEIFLRRVIGFNIHCDTLILYDTLSWGLLREDTIQAHGRWAIATHDTWQSPWHLLSPGCTSIKDTNWTKQGGSRRLDLRYVCTTSGRPELTACANIYCARPSLCPALVMLW